MAMARHLWNVATVAATLVLITVSMTAHTNSTPNLTASPMSGEAPLTVTFTGRGSGQLEGVMLLDFGDGQSDNSISTIRGFTRTHTYSAPGSYTAELKSGAYGGQLPAVLTTVGAVSITVN
jgi:PKD repeat protein